MHPFFCVVISKETVSVLEIPREESEAGVREALKPGILKLLFQEADGEMKLNWFTQKLDTEYQNVKCKGRIPKPISTIIIQKNYNGFLSNGLSVSHFSLFTSVSEEKLRTSKGSVSLHFVFDNLRNLIILRLCWLRKPTVVFIEILKMIICMCWEFYTFQSTLTSMFLINVSNYFRMQLL